MTVFEQQLQSAVAVAVRNATLTLRLPQGVTPKKAVKVLPIIQDFGPSVLADRQVVIQLGDLEKDNAQSVLVELMVHPLPEGFFRIVKVELTNEAAVATMVGGSGPQVIKVNLITNENTFAYVNSVGH